MITLVDVEALDEADGLAALRHQFELPDGLIYLDSNSLGALPRATRTRVAEVIERDWGQGLVGSWNSAGWFDLPRRLGDKLAPLIGAGPDEVVIADSTSVNLYKVLHAALGVHDERRSIVVSERANFPSDLYVAASVCRQNGAELRLVESDNVHEALSPLVGVLLLTEVNYRTSRWFDIAEVTAAAHHQGIVVVWDLCHSVGAVPIDLHAANADFAVGCTYKYLNGGPGSPAFVWAHPRHAGRVRQPLEAWAGHAAPFEFSTEYRPAAGSARFLAGTPSILSMAAVECGLDSVLAGAPGGEMRALREKSLALTDLFIALVDERLGDRIEIVTPRRRRDRGSHVSLAHPGAFGIVQALAARGVVGDFRAGTHGDPDLARFAFAPLYTRFADAWHAVDHLAAVLDSGEHTLAKFQTRQTVT